MSLTFREAAAWCDRWHEEGRTARDCANRFWHFERSVLVPAVNLETLIRDKTMSNSPEEKTFNPVTRSFTWEGPDDPMKVLGVCIQAMKILSPGHAASVAIYLHSRYAQVPQSLKLEPIIEERD